MLSIDNSKRSTFVQCPRKYYYQYVGKIETYYGSTALRYGTVFHAALDGFYSHIKENGWEKSNQAYLKALKAAALSWEEEESKNFFFDDFKTKETLVKCLGECLGCFAEESDRIKILDSEKAFSIEMHQKNIDPFNFTGKIDLTLEEEGITWIEEFKTTGWNVSLKLKEIERSFQIVGYCFAEGILTGEFPEGILIMIHYLNSRKKKDGEYGKLTTSYTKSPVLLTEDNIVSWLESFYFTVAQIQKCFHTGYFPKSENCFAFNTLCKYADLCDQHCFLGTEELGDKYRIGEGWDVLKTSKKVHYGKFRD